MSEKNVRCSQGNEKLEHLDQQEIFGTRLIWSENEENHAEIFGNRDLFGGSERSLGLTVFFFVSGT